MILPPKLPPLRQPKWGVLGGDSLAYQSNNTGTPQPCPIQTLSSLKPAHSNPAQGNIHAHAKHVLEAPTILKSLFTNFHLRHTYSSDYLTAAEPTNHQILSHLSPPTKTMLRRKPTALTITSEDIASFEESYLRKLAYARYLKTGEDPEGQFRNTANSDGQPQHQQNDRQQAQHQQQRAASGAVALDPNDELKPLPGDKARIVRSREERIGVGGAGAGVGGAGGNAR